MSNKILQALTNANLRTVGGLLRKSKEQLLEVDRLEEKSVNELLLTIDIFLNKSKDEGDKERKKMLVHEMLFRIGDDPNREGLKDTPERVVKMWKELYRGYDSTQKPAVTVFNNNSDGIHYDQMIHDEGYFFSQCEHHMIPFYGTYHFAYIPDKKLLGLSKVARIVDYFSAKLQVQERLTKEILDEIESQTKPLGIALILKGRHLCKEMRGVKKIGGEMTTSDLRGVFREEKIKLEFIR